MGPADQGRGVKGIAVIDPEKLTPPGPHPGLRFHWTMVEEQELVRELNEVLAEAARGTGTDPSAPGILLPVQPHDHLDPQWRKRNGGEHCFLPRTRYFFTGGVVYLAAELTHEQYSIFSKHHFARDPTIRQAALTGFRKFMLVVAKKHMPREYIEGQAHAGLIAAEAEGHDPAAADRARVILDTEPHLAFRGLSEVLRRSPRFFFRVKVAKDSDPPRPVRVVLVGDAYATTHFFTGSGVVNGLRTARSFGKALASGGTDAAWDNAEREVTATTDAMHHRAMQGSGNAPLDGPFNEGL